jgi:hypothetical protein
VRASVEHARPAACLAPSRGTECLRSVTLKLRGWAWRPSAFRNHLHSNGLSKLVCSNNVSQFKLQTGARWHLSHSQTPAEAFGCKYHPKRPPGLARSPQKTKPFLFGGGTLGSWGSAGQAILQTTLSDEGLSTVLVQLKHLPLKNTTTICGCRGAPVEPSGSVHARQRSFTSDYTAKLARTAAALGVDP